MARIDNIPLDYMKDPCSGNLTITLKSYGPVHTFLSWSYFPPIKKTRYKETRGIRTECGFTWRLENANCIEQQEPGETLIHTFQIPDQLVGICIWYIHTADCDFAVRPAALPPIKHCFDPCTSAISAVKVQSQQGPQFIGETGDSFIGQWNAKIYDPANILPPAPGGPLNLPGGYWVIRANPLLRFHPDFPGNASCRVIFRTPGASTLENNGIVASLGPDDGPSQFGTYARVFATAGWTATLVTTDYEGDFGLQVVNNLGDVYITADPFTP